MKTITEILSEEKSTATLVKRRDERNAEGRLTKAQREVQGMSEYQLWHWLQRWQACDIRVAQGALHPLQHPYRAIIDEIAREQLMKPHPASIAHPLAATQ